MKCNEGIQEKKTDSQVEITLKVEMEYRLLLAIDMSSHRHKKIFFVGCAKFHSLLLFKIQYGRQHPSKSLTEP